MSLNYRLKIAWLAAWVLPVVLTCADPPPLLPAHNLIVPARMPSSAQQPLPDAASQRVALNLIQSTFKTDYTDATPRGRGALAAKLLQQADATNDNPAAQFVLLLQSADAAILGGQPTSLTQAIDLMERHFAIDAPAMKTRSYKLIAPSCWTPAQSEQLAQGCLHAIDQAISADEYGNARQLQAIGQTAAAHSRDLGMNRQFQLLGPEVQALRQQYAEAKEALSILQSHPEDAHACRVAGEFLCFVKADWAAGLPILAHADDTALAAASKADLSAGDDAAAVARAADAWWNITSKLPTMQAERAQAHAANEYRRALPALEGLSKTIATQRLADFDNAMLKRLHLAAGLSAQLFEDKDFSEPNCSRIDPEISFDWGHQPPAVSMPKEDYSIRWLGKLRITQPGLYTFAVQANEGARVSLDKNIILQIALGAHHHTTQKINLQLQAGVHNFQLDFWAGTGAAKCKLLWTPPGSLALVPIPAEAFFHDGDGATP